jgi:hypothetical protein
MFLVFFFWCFVLSPSAVLYIPFHVCCTYVSTSRMWSASCAPGLYLRVWGLVGRYAGGGLLRVVRLFFRPGRPPKRPQVAQTPTRVVELGRHISRSSSSRARNRCARFLSARIMELLVSLSASDKVRAHRFFRSLHALKIRVFRQRASSLNDL